MRPHPTNARLQPLTAHRLERVLLGPATTPTEVDDACAAAVETGLAAVAVRPGWAGHALAATEGSPVRVVVTLSRLDDAEPAIADGARHLAVVLDAALRSGPAELAELARLAHASGVHLRTVLPLDLTGDRLGAAVRLAVEAGADELQAGSGLDGPAAAGQVCAIRAAVAPRHRDRMVVAAGGPGVVAAELVEAGADRLAVTDPDAILDGSRRSGGS